MSQQPRTLPPIPDGFWCEHKDATLTETPMIYDFQKVVAVDWKCNTCHVTYRVKGSPRSLQHPKIGENLRSAGLRYWTREFQSARKYIERGEVPKFGPFAPPSFAWGVEDLGGREIVSIKKRGPYLEIMLDGDNGWDGGFLQAPSTIDLSGAKWKEGCGP